MSQKNEKDVRNRVHIFAFVKNESLLMRDWIPYHASLVGFTNVHVIDHSSTDDSDAIYAKYQSQGLVVEKTEIPFAQKHKVLSRVMKKYVGIADFLIPLDGDEFLCARTFANVADTNNDVPDGRERRDQQSVILVADRAKVLHELDELPLDGRKLMLNQFLLVNDCRDYDDPLLQARRFVYTPATEDVLGARTPIVHTESGKAFYPASTFLWTDQGNHFGRVANERKQPGFHATSLCIAHYRVHGLTHFADKLQKGIAAYDLEDKPDNYDGAGNHWFKWMLKVRETDIETVFCRDWVQPNVGTVQPALAERIVEIRDAERRN